jgi:uncharacterized membrane protein
MGDKKELLPYLIVLFAFAFRIYRIENQSVWWDEAWSVHVARQGVVGALRLAIGDIHPPLYFILLHYWGKLAGFGELSIRFLSLIFSLLIVPSIYYVVRKVFDTKAALTTMAIAAFAPVYVAYAQEARMYAILPLLYLFIIYRLYQLMEGGGMRRRWWVELAIAEVLSIYLHYFSFFMLIYANLFIAFWRRRVAFALRRWFFSQLAVVLLYLPWVWIAMPRWLAYGNPYARPLDLLSSAITIWHFYSGGNLDAIGHHRLFATLSSIFAIAFLLALILLQTKEMRRKFLATVAHLAIPFAIVFLFWQAKPLFHPRYVIMFSVPLFILTGGAISLLGMANVWKRLSGASLFLSLIATFAIGLQIAYFDTRFHKDDARGLAEYLESISDADDVILIERSDFSPLESHLLYPGRLHRFCAIVGRRGLPPCTD